MSATADLSLPNVSAIIRYMCDIPVLIVLRVSNLSLIVLTLFPFARFPAVLFLHYMLDTNHLNNQSTTGLLCMHTGSKDVFR